MFTHSEITALAEQISAKISVVEYKVKHVKHVAELLEINERTAQKRIDAGEIKKDAKGWYSIKQNQ